MVNSLLKAMAARIHTHGVRVNINLNETQIEYHLHYKNITSFINSYNS